MIRTALILSVLALPAAAQEMPQMPKFTVVIDGPNGSQIFEQYHSNLGLCEQSVTRTIAKKAGAAEFSGYCTTGDYIPDTPRIEISPHVSQNGPTATINEPPTE